jgi:hypothetical protein
MLGLSVVDDRLEIDVSISFFRTYLWFHIAFGWFVSTLFVIAVSRLVRPDR